MKRRILAQHIERDGKLRIVRSETLFGVRVVRRTAADQRVQNVDALIVSALSFGLQLVSVLGLNSFSDQVKEAERVKLVCLQSVTNTDNSWKPLSSSNNASLPRSLTNRIGELHD